MSGDGHKAQSDDDEEISGETCGGGKCLQSRKRCICHPRKPTTVLSRQGSLTGERKEVATSRVVTTYIHDGIRSPDMRKSRAIIYE
mmetsp:Transcript_52225/g.56601  ORF Transcript_52225/g.56601 Transcript_52225/m.56601 type:complete len:86 (+) Transcript_52225:572-829(+)